ncbi:MAG TPA: hypothetical protein DDZ88_17825 [Verrucomicrobiales bacterium]|nr:hypothetical protein [Verrucomicrobiales bacterium]
MNISPPAPPLMPTIDNFTLNSEGPGAAVGFFDLLCLPGVVMAFLGNDAFTGSTGAGLSATMLYVEDFDPMAKAECMRTGTADSSAMMACRAANCHGACGDCASVFRLPFHDAIGQDFAAVLLALGGFVALLLEAAHGLQQEWPAQEPQANERA